MESRGAFGQGELECSPNLHTWCSLAQPISIAACSRCLVLLDNSVGGPLGAPPLLARLFFCACCSWPVLLLLEQQSHSLQQGPWAALFAANSRSGLPMWVGSNA